MRIFGGMLIVQLSGGVRSLMQHARYLDVTIASQDVEDQMRPGPTAPVAGAQPPDIVAGGRMHGDLLDGVQQLTEIDFRLRLGPMLCGVQPDVAKIPFRGLAKPDLNHGIARLRAWTP